MDFRSGVVGVKSGRVGVDEGNGVVNHDGQTSSTPDRTILADDVKPWKGRRGTPVIILQLGLLETTDLNVVAPDKIREDFDRITKTVAVPLRHDERRWLRGARIWMDARRKKEEEDKGARERKTVLPGLKTRRILPGVRVR